MRPNARQLAMRDPAMAANLGIIAGESSNFGHDSTFGGYGGNMFGVDFGMDNTPVAAPQPAAPMPNAAALHALWQQHQLAAAHTNHRELVLEPNKLSKVKIQRYAFAVVSPALTLGTPSVISGQNNPQTKFRPQRVTMNAPEPGFAIIQSIQVANVNVFVGGSFDAFDFNANGQDQTLDLPTLEPANQVTISGQYTGDLAGRAVGAYTFITSFKGPANIVA